MAAITLDIGPHSSFTCTTTMQKHRCLLFSYCLVFIFLYFIKFYTCLVRIFLTYRAGFLWVEPGFRLDPILRRQILSATLVYVYDCMSPSHILTSNDSVVTREVVSVVDCLIATRGRRQLLSTSQRLVRAASLELPPSTVNDASSSPARTRTHQEMR